MLGGDPLIKMSRKPEIMADAAYVILNKDSKKLMGQFLIDEDVLKNEGMTDMDKYACVPGLLLWQQCLCFKQVLIVLTDKTCNVHTAVFD